MRLKASTIMNILQFIIVVLKFIYDKLRDRILGDYHSY